MSLPGISNKNSIMPVTVTNILHSLGSAILRGVIHHPQQTIVEDGHPWLPALAGEDSAREL